MLQPTRLFDLLTHQLSCYPQADMLVSKEEGKWKPLSTQEVIRLVNHLSAGLLRLGISGRDLTPEHQDKIAIVSNNRPEWIITDLACQQIGAVLTPIYPTISITELEFVLTDAEAQLVFVSDANLYQKVMSVKTRVPAIKAVYTFDQILGALHWSLLLAEPTPAEMAQIDQIKQNIFPAHLATIIYTSGTTGNPKGVMLSHHNIVSNVQACIPCLPVNDQARALSFLPLNHIYERMITYLYIATGVSIYYAESMDTIGDNLREVQPSIFTTVPRLLEKVYERIMNKGLELKGIKRHLFFWAVNLGKKFEINKNLGVWYRLQLFLANQLVFNKWRQALGGRVQAIVTGSAACQVRLLKIFTAAGIPIMEGYGLTETSPVISVNRMEEENRMFGTVGPVIEGVEVRIAEDGEILCKGPNVMLGYYKQPDLTKEAIRDGWFHTGDIGLLINNKFLKITDRKKELFKTSGGKYVAPQPIENKLKESPYIEQVMVVGADRKFTGALIVPAFQQLKDWCFKNNVPFDTREQVIRDPRVLALFKQAVEKYNQYFNHIEQVKKFELLPQEWTVDAGELTPTLKLRRKVILEKYKEAIERIYA